MSDKIQKCNIGIKLLKNVLCLTWIYKYSLYVSKCAEKNYYTRHGSTKITYLHQNTNKYYIYYMKLQICSTFKIQMMDLQIISWKLNSYYAVQSSWCSIQNYLNQNKIQKNKSFFKILNRNNKTLNGRYNPKI